LYPDWRLADVTIPQANACLSPRGNINGLLPDEIIDRVKRGFAIPLGRWFRGKLENFVRDLLLAGTIQKLIAVEI
jgi:Asparagine synthase